MLAAHNAGRSACGTQFHTVDINIQHYLQVEHDVGADTLLSTRHLKLKVLSNGSSNLMSKWIGLFKVLKRIGPLAYRLDLPDSMETHRVWHMTYLKAYKTDGRKPPPPLPEMTDGELELRLTALLEEMSN